MADDYSQAVTNYMTAARSQVMAGSETSPDDAARTVQLESATGVPSQIIAPDLQGFEKAAQRDMATHLVSQNPELMAYVHSHPMAASVSQNDWGNMNTFSQGATNTAAMLKSLNGPWEQAIPAGIEGAKEGFKEGFGDWPTYHPSSTAAGNLLQSAGLLGQVGLQTMSGLFSAAMQGAGETARAGAEAMGMDKSSAASLGRDISGMVESEGIRRQAGHVEPFGPMQTWLGAGKEPPRGVDPLVDQAKAQVNAETLTQIDADIKNAQAAETKDISPEMFQRFAEQHYGNSTIAIEADAALKLYGNKLPEPDDGKLGWVPGIADKLEQAKLTGSDVEVPTAGYISHIDPALHKELHDDLRVWPGGITAREAIEEPPTLTQMVGDPLARVRGTAGLEPMFAMGDRKLSLIKTGEDTLPIQGKDGTITDQPYHILDIQDENGQMVGSVEISPDSATKTLHLEMIHGVAGQWANSFGPGLIKDLKAQLKALYPDFNTLDGYRVSGAAPGREVSVRLDAAIDESTNRARDILASAYRPIDAGLEANIQPTAFYTAHEKALSAAVHDEVAKITGGKAKVIPTAGIRYQEGAPQGAFFPKSSMILYDLLGEDPVGIGRHESIHWLRNQGLFSEHEWATLKTAALEEGWQDRYNIHSRYTDLHEEGKLEESIAEAFREWAGQKDEARRQYSPVAQIFQKLWDFLQNIKQRFNEITGKDLTKEDLFTKVASGDLAQRQAMGSVRDGPLFSMEEMDNLKADSLGLDRKAFTNIQKLVQERYRRDVEASQARAEKEQVKRQTKEWKDNREALRTDVESSIRQRPDVAADLFIGSGELYGEKLKQRFTLRADDLTAEQKASLPDHYISKNGLPVDEVGKLFGYPTGDSMVGALAALKTLKGDRSPQAMLKHITDLETDRQMEAKYGDLGANILSGAQDQALAENDLNLLTEEYHAAALQGGVASVDKDTILAKAKDIVSKTPLNEVDFNKQMALIGRAYRDAVRALANGDPANAVIALEKRTLAAHVAAEMKKVQAEKAKFDGIAKRYAKRWDPAKDTAVEPNFSIFTRDILSRVGLPNGMSIPGLAKAIAESPYKDGLSQFITETENDGKISGLELPVPSWLMSLTGGAKPLNTMTVGEFREVRDAVTVMDKVGRADQKVLKAGEAQDRSAWISEARQQLANKFSPVSLKKKGTLRQAMTTALAVTTSNETLMSRFDGRDPHGIFTETITKPGAEAANRKARMQRELAASYRELGPIKDLTKSLESPLVDPRTGKSLPLDRRNLASIISNMGNNYNWSILTKGWKVDPDVLWKWVEGNSTPEDIERAQNLGKIFSGLKSEADKEYLQLYGIAPESVVPRQFQMHGRTFDGWYHPIIGDPQLSRFVNKMPELGVEGNFWPSTSNAYMKRRTGAVQVVDLTYDAIPGKLDQVIHDISFRSFVSNTAKIFKDSRFREGIRTFYGKEYMEEMDQWLQRIAGDSSYNTSAMQLASKLSNAFRQNVVSTQIAFNLGTVEKHGLTAGLMSARELSPNLLKSVPEFGKVFAEVAPSLFKRAVGDMFGHSAELGDGIFNFIESNSEEIQRRKRNVLDTIGGQHRVLESEGKPIKEALQTGRTWLTEKGASLVAFSDLLSSAPLWLAKYRAEMEATGIHGDAVREADMAVRRAHGSTAVTNLPRIAANSGPITPWLTSLYGFMGTSMQRRIEIFHDINDAYKLGMSGQIREATKMVPSILSSVGVYVLYTGLVEEMVTGQFTDDRRGLGSKAMTFLFGSVAQSIIGIRDLVHDIQAGRESVGLFSTPIHDWNNLYRDLGKHQPLSRDHIGKLLQDGCSSIGDLGGLCPKHLGTIGHYGLDVFNGFQHPRTGGDIYRGAISGQQKLHVVK